MVKLSSLPLKKIKTLIIPGILISIIVITVKSVFMNSDDYAIANIMTPYPVYHSTQLSTTPEIEIKFQLNTMNVHLYYNVHIFYYAWYGNLKVDKKWIHWNHKRLPHWSKMLVNDYSLEEHNPPDDIGADFYPALGLYSSRNKTIIRMHMEMIKYTGIGVIVLSWYAKGRSDPNGEPMDDLVNTFLDEANNFNLKVAIHLEPYSDRSIDTVKEDLSYIALNYANHSAYFKKPRFKSNTPLPVVFIYDSYLIENAQWMRILREKRNSTIRGTVNDFFLVGLLLERDSCENLFESGFDAGYTYFAGDQVSYCSHSDHWIEMNRKCSLKNIEFYPSFGPGYKDQSVRPWNTMVTRNRNNGDFFLDRFKKAKKSGARAFGITSFNEWHEGTQIEPAVPHFSPTSRLAYETYSPHSPLRYLDLTKKMVEHFRNDSYEKVEIQ